MNNNENNIPNNDLVNTNEGSQSGQQGSNAIKDPNEWTTGSEPMTGAQKSYLKTLSDSAGVEFNENMTKAETAIKIDELQKKSLGKNPNSSEDNKGYENTVKDPNDWKTGDEEMTGAQRSYLKTLTDEAGEEFKDNITKAEASKKIDEMQKKTGRGQ